jgi:hypothetical protein
VKGILIEGNDGQEYLLGFGPFKDSAAASKVAVKQLGLTGRHVIGPGILKDFFLWFAFQEALKAFPPIPTWPTWSS